MRLSSSTSITNSTSNQRERTPSFVCEIPLRVTRRQEKKLEARFEAARQLYNTLLVEARRRLVLFRQSVWYTDEQGRFNKGKRPTKKSRRQQETQAELADLFRREAAHRKTLHGQMVNRILAMGSDGVFGRPSQSGSSEKRACPRMRRRMV